MMKKETTPTTPATRGVLETISDLIFAALFGAFFGVLIALYI
jgi:hypothetical protein